MEHLENMVSLERFHPESTRVRPRKALGAFPGNFPEVHPEITAEVPSKTWGWGFLQDWSRTSFREFPGFSLEFILGYLQLHGEALVMVKVYEELTLT